MKKICLSCLMIFIELNLLKIRQIFRSISFFKNLGDVWTGILFYFLKI